MEILMREIKKVDLKSPLLIEGLPGVGHVGKLVAEHLIEELGAIKIMEIYSKYFPPQVIVGENSVVHLLKNEIYAWKGEKKEKRDLLFLVGDFQSVSNEGHYAMIDTYLDIAEKYGVDKIYTLGGYGVGYIVEEPSVICAVNDEKLLEEVKKYGGEFKDNEPGGGIAGAAGLLLGMGKLRGLDGICLMGTTSGYLVDPKSAQQVLKMLCRLLDIEVDMGELEKRAEEMEKVIEKIKASEGGVKEPLGKKEEYLGYYV